LTIWFRAQVETGGFLKKSHLGVDFKRLFDIVISNECLKRKIEMAI
jgi:hypothetical protein